MTAGQMMLDLDPECITRPTQIDVMKIQFAMLWPTDPARQNRALKAYCLQNLIDETPDPKTMTREELREMLVLARDADGVESHPHDPESFRRGMAVGFSFFEAIGLSVAAPNSKIHLKSIKGKFADLPGDENRKPSTKQQDWDDFRSVATLWASFVYRNDNGCKEVWPCAVGSITDFLATAEAFRIQGEKLHPKQSPRPLLYAGESISLPSWIKFPTIHLAFSVK